MLENIRRRKRRWRDPLFRNYLQTAQEPTTNPDFLSTLAHSLLPEVSCAATGNPNVPFEAALVGGRRHPQALLDNPAFPLWLIENPRLLARFPRAALLLLAEQTTDAGVLAQLAQEDLPAVRCAVAVNPACPVSVLRFLADSPDVSVRIAASASLPPEDMQQYVRLGSCDNLSARTSECDWEMTSEELQRLALDAHTGYWRASLIIAHPNVNDETLAYFARHQMILVRADVASRPHLSLSVQEILDESDDRTVRWGFLRNPTTDKSILRRAILDQDTLYYSAILQNTAIDDELLALLFEQDPVGLSQKIIDHPLISDVVLQRILLTCTLVTQDSSSTPIHLAETDQNLIPLQMTTPLHQEHAQAILQKVQQILQRRAERRLEKRRKPKAPRRHSTDFLF